MIVYLFKLSYQGTKAVSQVSSVVVVNLDDPQPLPLIVANVLDACGQNPVAMTVETVSDFNIFVMPRGAIT